jgi:hypothetical protein
LAVTLLLTTAFAGNASAAVDPTAFSLSLQSVDYISPYTANAVTIYHYRLSWNPTIQNSPGLSHVDLQICSTLVSKVNSLYTTPGYVFGDGSAPNQCSLTSFTNDSTIVKWDSSLLTLVSGHFDFDLALDGTYGAGTSHFVAFAGSNCSPSNGGTVEGPSCDTDRGCPGMPWCPPVCIPAKVSVPPANATICETAQNPTFTVVAAGTDVVYQWSDANGPIQGANSASFTPSASGPGTYSYSVSVSNGCGQDSAPVTLTIHKKTTVDALSPKDACETGTAVQFTASNADGQGSISYSWSFNGNVVPDSNSSSFTTPAGLGVGSYPVSVTVSGSGACASTTSSTTLTIHQKTDVADLQNADACANNTAVQFTASATGESLTYQWSVDGSPVSGATSASFTTAATLSVGAHTVSVNVHGAGSCADDSASATLTVHAETKVDALSPKESCGINTVTFTANATGEGLSYAWTLKDSSNNTVSTGSSASFTIASGLANGIYTVSVTVTGSQSCANASSSTTLTIKECPPTCTLTQGAWGSGGGAGSLGGVTSAISGGMTFGNPSGNKFTVSSSYDAGCLMLRLPAGGPAGPLPSGANSFTGSSCLTTKQTTVKQGKSTVTTDAFLTGMTSKDKFNNVLLGQTIALALNIKSDANLGGTGLCKYMKVDTLAGGSPRTLDSAGGIPGNVWNDLGANPTVQSLLNLANAYLGGNVSSASYSEVNQAVTAINQLFDACPAKRYVMTCLASAPQSLSTAVSQLAAGPAPIGLCSSSIAIGQDGTSTSLSISPSILKVMTELGLSTELRGIVELRAMVRDGYDNLSFDDLNLAIDSLNEAVAQQRTNVSCSDR